MTRNISFFGKFDAALEIDHDDDSGSENDETRNYENNGQR